MNLPKNPPDLPTEEFAQAAAEGFFGTSVPSVFRFKTGYDHYVYDCVASDERRLVVRATTPKKRRVMENALRINQELRSIGVPLPAVLHSDLIGPIPYLLLERLPGRDLGYVYHEMKSEELSCLAQRIGAIQKLVRALPLGAGFGFAASGKDAPLTKWSDVIRANQRRSLQRMSSSTFLDRDLGSKVEQAIARYAEELDRQAPEPFLHDITTKNVLIHDGTLSGIVDVDDLCFGDSRLTIALTRTSLLREGDQTNYIDYWLQHEGYECDWRLELYTAVFSLDLMSEYGMRFNGNEPQTKPEDLATLEKICRESLRRI